MIETALKKGIYPRVEVGSFEQAKPFLDMGVRHFCIGWDIVTIAGWCRTQAEGMQKLLENACLLASVMIPQMSGDASS